MVFKTGFLIATKKDILFFIFGILLFADQGLFAQDHTDTAKTFFVAALEKKEAASTVTIPSNVIFPEILKGNEAEMLPYIEKYSIEKRSYLKKMYTKGRNYFPRVATILKKYKLPDELKNLLALESEYDANAVSRAGAVGYWQIMDEMAVDYGLNVVHSDKTKSATPAKQNRKDDRKDFTKATNAVARFLHDRKQNLDENWLLVVASYNCGLGNVKKAIRKSGKINPTFWDIKNYLPAETRSYVMNFITLSVIFSNYAMFAANKLNFAPQTIMVLDEDSRDAIKTMPGYSNL
ncbi:MAG: LysM repeat-containing protein [Ferruginibacter sp.]|nr:LysM repeat-containing protein [Ferruginibacter sp.]